MEAIVMTHGFVWFHNSSDNAADTSTFYEKLLGWKASAGPAGLTMLAGETGPFAGVAPKEAGVPGWIPYAQVDDVEAATKKAQRLGATILSAKTRGPAGEFSIVRDPGGAAVALWQKA
jgi:predicted enzyme related to lactoylglutathione lyase